MSPEEIDSLGKKGVPLPSDGTAHDTIPIQKALLRKHAWLYHQLTLLQYGSRAACLGMSLFLAAVPACPPHTLFGMGVIFLLLVGVWSAEQYRLGRQIRAMERAIAEAAKGKWEDVFIVSKRVEPRDYDFDNPFLAALAKVTALCFRYEKMWWLVILDTVVLCRIWFPG